MKLTLLTEVKSVIPSEIEIETPAFRKMGWSFYKVTDAGTLVVHNRPGGEAMYMQNAEKNGKDILWAINHCYECTEDEFNEAFCQVHNIMSALQLGHSLKATA